jgi:Xaa-Pro aminopeptidase
VKTPEELVLLRRAIDISVLAHREAMKSIEPEMYEYEVEALAEYVFQRNGAAFAGYPSIVGSGENSTILHYNTNRRQMQGNDLVVMDMGAEYLGYTADVTRTVPVDGVFSPEEKAIYELVLQAQEAGIEAARAGNAFGAPGQAAWRIISDGLRALGLVKTDDDVRNFFMHGTSHYLGLWVHDVGDGQPFVPGTVITVEPGIYIRPSTGVDPKWWNIGVRIEDDILITDGDPVNLSAAAPRTVAEIEALMREQGLGNVAGSTLPRSDNTGER